MPRSVLALGVAACGSDNDNVVDATSDRQRRQPDPVEPRQREVTLTVGSKNFTEEFILGEIYAQALEAAGYNVKTNLNLGSETSR